LNLGIATNEGELELYLMSSPTLNTFSKESVNIFIDEGYSVIGTQKIKVSTLNKIIDDYLGGCFPNFISLDTEGSELNILKSIDYEKSYPQVICVETISFSEKGRGVKDIKIIEFLTDKVYMVFANTYINTIFVRKIDWIR